VQRSVVALFDHVIGDGQDVRRDSQAECPCTLEVDDELKFAGLFDRNIGGIRAPQNLIDQNGRALKQVVLVHRMGHQAAVESVSFERIDRRQFLPKCEVGDELSVNVVRCVSCNDERVWMVSYD
jgi:hypothetical protein